MTYSDVSKITSTLQHCNLSKIDKMGVKIHTDEKGSFLFTLEFQVMAEKSI